MKLSDCYMHTENPFFVVELSEIYSCPPLPEKEANKESISIPLEIDVAQELHVSSTFQSQIPNIEPVHINAIKSTHPVQNSLSDPNTQTLQNLPHGSEQNATQKRHSRKRVRNVEEWNLSKRNKLRNSAKTNAHISEEERQAVFHAFWGSGSLAKQRDYLCSVVNKNQKEKTNYSKILF